MRPALALLLCVPLPSLGAWAALHAWPDTSLGQAIFSSSKAALLLFPLFWTRWVDREHFSISRPTAAGLRAGLVSGLLIFFGIIAAWLLFGRSMVNAEVVATKARDVGLGSNYVFLGGALYWTFINALLEEYFWRWFVYRQCERLVGARRGVMLSAVFFTIHHAVALAAYVDLTTNVLCNIGIGIGGIVWSSHMRQHGSVWPGYVSHIFADIAVFGIAWTLIFST